MDREDALHLVDRQLGVTVEPVYDGARVTCPRCDNAAMAPVGSPAGRAWRLVLVALSRRRPARLARAAVPLGLMARLFKDHWFQAQKARGVAAALDLVTADHGEFVEVGSWEGQSSSFITNRIHPSTLHCFDHWLGHESDDSFEKAQARDVFAEFKANMDALTQRNYEVQRGDWRGTLPAFLGEHAVRFLYLDAAHTYDEVKAQLDVILFALVAGAVLAGDDFNVRGGGVGRAVRERLPEVTVVPKGNGVWFQAIA